MQGASAAVDGVSLAGVTVADAQTLIATVPAHAPGKTAVTVTNPGGDSGNRAAVLRYADVDLLLQGMTAPKAGAPDRRFVATTTTRNIGAHASDTTVTRFYLSRDAVLDAADVLLGQHKVPALAPGKTHVGNASLLTPYATAAGEYYLLAQADSAGLVAELSETNNGRAARFSVGSNLAVTALTALPTARADEGLDITVTTANTGPASTGRTSTTTVYLSADQSTGGSDVTLGSVYISDLDPREAQRKLASVLIPANTRPGIYYLVAKADAGSYVTEINEDDNTRARPVEILPAITRPDRKR
jgi:subtilase family serine protease